MKRSKLGLRGRGEQVMRIAAVLLVALCAVGAIWVGTAY